MLSLIGYLSNRLYLFYPQISKDERVMDDNKLQEVVKK